jgi:hypothetical protein
LSKKLVLTACALAACSLAMAKLPALDDAAKAKAAETAAKAAWQAKVDAWKLCQVQDRIAAQYRKSAASRPVANVPAGMTTNASTGAAAPAAAAAPGAGATAAAAAAAPSTPSNSGNPTTTAQAGGTPVASVAAAPAIPPCADPGPFAYNPPSQTPLETSGAHSPAGNAATPPSVRPESAKMAPAQPATQSSKQPATKP